MNFKLPARFDDSVFNWIEELQNLDDVHELLLDFSSVEYVFPFHTLAIAISIRELIEKRNTKGLKTSAIGVHSNSGAISYLKYFGFFRGIGLPVGNPPNQINDRNSYLPITIITRNELESASTGEPYQNQIDRRSDHLSQVIFPGEDNSGAAIMLSYCFREIIRNSFEHAGVNKCFVMAQRWYDGDAEITIADRGMGIYDSLKQKHAVTSPENALKLALMPGITSGGDRATGSEWDNSGFGLYVTSEIGKRFGNFSILSSNKLLLNAGQNNPTKDVPLHGTIVKLKVNTNDGDYFPNILKQIIGEGEKIALNISGSIKTASKMSRSFSPSNNI